MPASILHLLYRKDRASCVAIGFALVLAVAGWRPALGQEPPNPEATTARADLAQFYEDALVKFEAEEYKEAVIQLKNALQQDSKHLPSRILLGRAFLAYGYPRLAESELLLAKSMGADASVTDVPLAEVYLQLGKFDELLDQVKPSRRVPAESAKIQVLRGRAYLALGDEAQAAAAFNAATELDPETDAPLLGKVMVLLRRDQREQANALLEDAIALDPENAEAWVLKGRLAQQQERPEEAVEHLTRALAIEPDDLEGLLARASLYVDLGRLQEAQEDLDRLQAQPEVDPVIGYLQALVYARNGEDERAREALGVAAETLAEIPPEALARSPKVLLLAGVVAFLLDRIEEAAVHLEKLLALQPGNARAARVMAAVRLAQNKPEEALRVIQPVFEGLPGDASVLLLKGRAHLALEEYEAATRMFEQAVATRPDDDRVQMDLARSQIGGQQTGAAIETLENLLRLRQDDAAAAIMLAVLHLQKGQPDAAVAAAQSALEREPTSVVAFNLMGIARLAQGDRADARAALERALDLDPDFFPAKLNLAKVDIQDDPQQARERYRALLKDDAKNQEVLSALARLEEGEGNSEPAIRWWEKLRSHYPDRVDAGLKLVDLYIRAGKPKQALKVAADMQVRAPDDFRVQVAVGVGEMAAGETDNAKVTFRNLTRSSVYDADKLHLIARYQIQLGDLENAYWSLSKTVAARPDLLQAQAELAGVEIRLGKAGDVMGRALDLQVEYPDRGVGYLLEGDVQLSSERYAQAEKAYLQAQAIEPGTQVALRLYRARVLDGRRGLALEDLEAWVKAHPDALDASKVLGGALVEARRYPEARLIYERLLGKLPENASILNDLAMLYQMEDDPRALVLATKAHALAPDDPLVADTLGWVLVKMGKPAEGLLYLREAQSRDASLPDISYHLAAALHALERSKEARKVLERALSGTGDFVGRGAAEALLQQLSSGD